MECRNCKKSIEPAENCPYCGANQGQENQSVGNGTKLKNAIKMAKAGGIVAWIIAAITAVLAFMGMQNGQLAALVDAALIFFLGLGIFIYRSRVASVSVAVFYILSKIAQIFQFKAAMSKEEGFFSAFALISIAFAIVLIVGVVGTFRYHKILENKIHKKNTLIRILISVLYGFVAFFICLMIVALIPNLRDDLKTLILFLPAMTLVYLSLAGLLPFSNKYPMIESQKTPS